MSYSETITKTDLANILNEIMPFGGGLRVELFSKSASFSGKSYVDISVSLPIGATVLGASLTKVPNPNWISCGIESYSSTTVRVSYNNTYSSAISGTAEVAVFYTV